MGCENEADGKSDPVSIGVATGLGLAAEAGMPIYKEILDYYASIHFIKKNSEIDTDTVVSKVTRILKRHGLKNTSEIQSVAGLNIYPKVYFCPGDKERATGIYNELTYTAHHYTASWRNEKFNQRVKNPVWRLFFGIAAWTGQTLRDVVGERRWIKIRDKYLTGIHNFVRGSK